MKALALVLALAAAPVTTSSSAPTAADYQARANRCALGWAKALGQRDACLRDVAGLRDWKAQVEAQPPAIETRTLEVTPAWVPWALAGGVVLGIVLGGAGVALAVR